VHPLGESDAELFGRVFGVEKSGNLSAARDSGMAGMNVLAYLAVGPELSGVVVPADAVVSWQGKAWVYVKKGEGQFARREIPLDMPARDGWFVSKGLSPADSVVTTGAQQILSEDGWLDTGDNGTLTVDGNLVITGRTKHALLLGNGVRVEPEPVEMAVQESPYVREAVLVGRESLGLLIVPNMDWLRRFAASHRIKFRNPEELVAHPAVLRFYREEVTSLLVNRGIRLPGDAQPRNALVPGMFEIGRELTRTMSKRREVITEMYAGLIEKMGRS
jgi:acyl-CoA synthetase (AMP-forming)/AMP-acid ligase II